MVAGITVRVASIAVVIVVFSSSRPTRPGKRTDTLHHAFSDPPGVSGYAFFFLFATGGGNVRGRVYGCAGGIGSNGVIDVEQLDAASVVVGIAITITITIGIGIAIAIGAAAIAVLGADVGSR
jgi:hypothetical protein